MFSIRVDSNVEDVIKTFQDARRDQIPFATALALTRTGQQVKTEEVAKMRVVFDRPTRYTLNSLQLTPATKNKLIVDVWFKDFAPTGGIPSTNYLPPEVFGGGRNLKRFEVALQRIGIMPQGMYSVPAAGAKLDAYGNMSRGQIVQLLSWFQAFGEQGYRANITAKTKARRIARGGVSYFASRGRGFWFGMGSWRRGHEQHLPAGIWMRSGPGGRQIKPVLLFVRAPRYRVAFEFFKIAERTYDARFKDNFAKAFEQAVRTRRA